MVYVDRIGLYFTQRGVLCCELVIKSLGSLEGRLSAVPQEITLRTVLKGPIYPESGHQDLITEAIKFMSQLSHLNKKPGQEVELTPMLLFSPESWLLDTPVYQLSLHVHEDRIL